MFKAFRHHVRTVIGAGLLVVIPIWITFMLLQFLAVRLDGVLGSQVPRVFGYFGYEVKEIPGLGITVMVLAIYCIGIFARNLFGRQIVHMTELVLGKVPIVRTVYTASKQLLETVALQQKDGFKRVVLIEYPRRGVYCLAFVTSETRGEIRARTGRDILNIFVPTTPNPTSGYLVFIPREEVIPLDMSIEDGIKYVVSGGFVTPSHFKETGPSKPLLSNDRTPPHPLPRKRRSGPRMAKTLLLVDDSVTIREVVALTFEKTDLTVRTADETEGAWKILQQEGADIVVADADKSSIGGWELCRRIKGDPTIGSTPVVLFSSGDEEAPAPQGVTPDALLSKPFGSEDLRRTVAALIDLDVGAEPHQGEPHQDEPTPDEVAPAEPAPGEPSQGEAPPSETPSGETPGEPSQAAAPETAEAEGPADEDGAAPDREDETPKEAALP
ncbi:MAG: DUF502 domain-containing protein, partial [Nitrospinota bacterium]